MNRSPRLFGSLVGIISGWAVGTAIYHMLLTGSCSTPPGPGEVACPPEMFQYALYMIGGIFGGVIGSIAGGSWLAFGALFGGIGLGGVLAGLEPVENGGQKWFIFFGACFLLTPALMLISLPFVGLRKMRLHHLLQNGLQGTGTLLDIQDTGVTINNNPRVRMRFRIESSQGMFAPYEATKTTTVNRLNLPRVGERYPVWVDPDDHQKFAFATGRQGEPVQGTSLRKIVEAAKQGAQPAVLPPPVDVVAQLNTLNELRISGKISADEFARRTSDLINAPTA
jgi:hypothetical protein